MSFLESHFYDTTTSHFLQARLEPNRHLLRIHVVVEGVNPHVLMNEPGEEVNGVARGLLHDLDVAYRGGPLARHQIAVFPASDYSDLRVAIVSDGEAIGTRPATTMAHTTAPASSYINRRIHCCNRKPILSPPTKPITVLMRTLISQYIIP
jgi:hypothetical protein